MLNMHDLNCSTLPRSTSFHASNKIQAVVTDVDGTLLPFGTNQQLSQANCVALRRVVDQGLHVCLATGRIPGPWSDSIRSQVPGLGPGIFANGALVVSPDGGVLSETHLPADAVNAIEAYARRVRAGDKGLIAVLAAVRWEAAGLEYGSLRYLQLAPGEATWVTKLIASAQEPEVVMVPDLQLPESREVYKAVMLTDPDDPAWISMDDVRDNLLPALEDTNVHIIDQGKSQIEILPPGTHKGAALNRLLEYLGDLHLEAVLACGDAENDVEMLRSAGIGVAMGDGKPQAKEAADVVVAASNQDGVAEAISRFVFPEDQ